MKKLLYIIITLVLMDIWVGVNLANHQPPFSNPFATPEARERVTKKLKETARRSTDVVEQTLEEAIKPSP